MRLVALRQQLVVIQVRVLVGLPVAQHRKRDVLLQRAELRLRAAACAISQGCVAGSGSPCASARCRACLPTRAAPGTCPPSSPAAAPARTAPCRRRSPPAAPLPPAAPSPAASAAAATAPSSPASPSRRCAAPAPAAPPPSPATARAAAAAPTPPARPSESRPGGPRSRPAAGAACPLAQQRHRQAHLVHVEARGRRPQPLCMLASPSLLALLPSLPAKARRGTGGRMPRPRAGAGTVSSSDSAILTPDTLRGTRRRPRPRCGSGSPEGRLKKLRPTPPRLPDHATDPARARRLSFRRGGKARRPHGRCGVFVAPKTETLS